MIFFTYIENSPEIRMEAQGPNITKAILSKKSNSGGIVIPDFEHYRITVAKIVWF
jgi:hypothetical protein